MRDEHERRALLTEAVHAVDALLLELDVTNRQHLVDEEDVRLHVGGDREAEPRHHPRRVRSQRRVDELYEAGERHDIAEASRHVPTGMAEHRAIQEDVFAPREFWIEPGTQLEQRHDTARRRHAALAWTENAGDHLQERRLASAVPADDPHRFSGPHGAA